MAAAAASAASSLELKCVHTIRLLCADMVQKAKSGHPGAPMGCAPIAHVLWSRFMKYNPSNPSWFNRDRFILSNGHACALLYAMLHVTGYDLPMEELKKFRQVHSITAGHPENVLHPAIEATTGPLGQGISQGVGMAIAARHLGALYNPEGEDAVIDPTIWVLCGDGCLQEGISGEASSLAGHLGLSNLIVLYDDNRITIDGSTDLSFTEDVAKRYEAYGWRVLEVADGNTDLAGIEAAVKEAQAETDKPTMIKVRTSIGFGSSKADDAGAHGAPLGDDVLAETKKGFGFDPEATFAVDDDVLAFYGAKKAEGAALEAAWTARMEAFSAKHADKAAELKRRIAGELPEGLLEKLPRFTPEDKKEATRSLSGKVINVLAGELPDLIAGSADLTPSNKTLLKMSGDFQKGTPKGRYFRFGVREHAMAAISNGMVGFGGIIPFVGTFLNFIGYAAGAVRVSAISHFRVVYVATHDSIALGEDGPTHQPVEMGAMLRAMPNIDYYRPADGNEVSACYYALLGRKETPAVVALSRQGLPHLAGSSIEAALKGGYTVHGADEEARLLIVASGSEVSLAIAAAKEMGAGVRVASFPCLEIFQEQDKEYIASVIPKGVPVLSVEAAATFGWERFSHSSMGVDTFGLSGPGPKVYEALGLTAAAVKARAEALLSRFSGSAAPELPIHYI